MLDLVDSIRQLIEAMSELGGQTALLWVFASRIALERAKRSKDKESTFLIVRGLLLIICGSDW